MVLLDIKPLKQDGAFMCIPACVEMVIKYLFPYSPFNQHDIMRRVWINNHNKIPKNYPNNPFSNISFGSIETVLFDLKIDCMVTHIQGREEGKSSEDIIKIVAETIQSKKTPVLLSLKIVPIFGKPKQWINQCCHIILIKGYKEDNLIFNETVNNIQDSKPRNSFLPLLSNDRDILIIEQ